MPTAADYHIVRDGSWRLVVLPEAWNRELEKTVLALVREQNWSKHPQTLEVEWPTDGALKQYYLKVFHRVKGAGVVKDLCRVSKAFRFWRQGVALSAAGFQVPATVAAGEVRRWRFIERAFVLTAKIDGQPLPAYLADLNHVSDRQKALKLKRAGVVRLAHLIREFHRHGFVHGDMVASNLLISQIGQGELSLFFMDNDRTRHYPKWIHAYLWKRNLIQLNRMPLPGITLQDRIWFLRAYLDRNLSSHGDRGLMRWLEGKTRKRRQECDGVDPTVNFRKLMRWPAARHQQ